MNRERVYKVIDGERNYQESQNKKWDHQGKITVEAEILMMEEYIKKLREAWVNNYGPDQALDVMRKVVGIGVRCFENHGCPERKYNN